MAGPGLFLWLPRYSRREASAMLRIQTLCLLGVLVFSPSLDAATIVGKGFDPTDSLELNLSLEDSVFLEHEEISVIVCATNRGSRVLPAIARPTYLCGYFDFEMFNVRTGQRMPRTMYSCGIVNGAWDLKPGESLCDITELGSHFGGRNLGPSLTLRRGMDGSRIPPGRYRLSAHYPARVLHDRKHRQFSIRTEPVEFRIDSFASSSEEVSLAEAFDRLGPFPPVATDSLRNLCVAWLPKFYDSALFDQIYWRARLRIPQPPLDTLFRDLRALERKPFRRIIIANTYIGRYAPARLADTLEPYLQTPPGPQVLSSWRVGPMRAIPWR
jgi:hypothetical protein